MVKLLGKGAFGKVVLVYNESLEFFQDVNYGFFLEMVVNIYKSNLKNYL